LNKFIKKWLSPKEMKNLKDNPGIDSIDIKAIIEGQAEAKMRSYARKGKVYKS